MRGWWRDRTGAFRRDDAPKPVHEIVTELPMRPSRVDQARTIHAIEALLRTHGRIVIEVEDDGAATAATRALQQAASPCFVEIADDFNRGGPHLDEHVSSIDPLWGATSPKLRPAYRADALGRLVVALLGPGSDGPRHRRAGLVLATAIVLGGRHGSWSCVAAMIEALRRWQSAIEPRLGDTFGAAEALDSIAAIGVSMPRDLDMAAEDALAAVAPFIGGGALVPWTRRARQVPCRLFLEPQVFVVVMPDDEHVRDLYRRVLTGAVALGRDGPEVPVYIWEHGHG